MATVNDIINSSFDLIGLGNPSNADSLKALIALNNMIGLWGLEVLGESVISENFALSVGKDVYTIGSGGDFDTVRPVRVESFYIRDSNGYDRIVKEFSSTEYDKITDKSISGKPRYFYYLSEYPLGKIVLNREPDENYTAYFKFIKHFTEYSALTDTVSLPNEYKEALAYNLAVSEASKRDIQLNQLVYLKAEDAKRLIDMRNMREKIPAKVKFGRGEYNIFTDEFE